MPILYNKADMKKHIQPVAIGVVWQNGKFLLTLRNNPDDKEGTKYVNFWQFPGGGQEFGESLEECLVREMKEEIGHDIHHIRLIPRIFSEVRGKTWHGVLIPYLCDLTRPNEAIRINDEADDFAWYTLEEIHGLQQMKWTYEIAEEGSKILNSR